MNWVFVFIGGGIGSVLRFAISSIPFLRLSSGFALGTLVSNFIASLILGFLSYIFIHHIDLPDHYKVGLTVGVCGGLSTFSTFTAESFKLIENGSYLHFFLYVIVSITICLAAFLMGVKLAEG